MLKRNSYFYQKLTLFLMAGICIGINLYLRLFPVWLPQLKRVAIQNLKKVALLKAEKEIEKDYPNLPLRVKKQIVRAKVNFIFKDKEALRSEIKKEYLKLRDRWQDENNQTYLFELDPYQWLRNTEFVLQYGYPGNKKIGPRKYIDTYMLAPRGAKVTPHQFLFYFSAYLYRIYTFWFGDIELAKFVFYLPVFFSLIFFVILYFFIRYFFSDLAAFFSVFLVGLGGIFLRRSCGGWFDTDVWNLTWPILIIWSLNVAIKKGPLKNIFYSLLAGLFLAFFAWTWPGWWFIYIVVLGSYGFLLFNQLFIYSQDAKRLKQVLSPYLLSLLIFIAGSFAFCMAIADMNPFVETYRSLSANFNLGKPFQNSIWPDTYYTVAELRAGSLNAIFAGLWGSKILFLFSLIGSLWFFIKDRRGERASLNIFLLFWLFFMGYASLKGIRFVMFLGPILGIYGGAFFAELIYFSFSKLDRLPDLRLRLLVLLSVIVGVFFCTHRLFKVAWGISEALYPLINDVWYKTLLEVKDKTPPSAIFNSWWDFGNFFKAIARRRVIFDGQTQRTPLAYWMANVLLSSDEDRAVRILRMMNNSSNGVFEIINNYIKDPFRSIAILEKILKKDSEQARAILEEEGFSEKLSQRILRLIYFKNPAPAYFIVEASMVSKMMPISFLGNWDFRKLYVYRNRNRPASEVINNLAEIFEISLKEAQDLYSKVSFISEFANINEIFSKRYQFKSLFMKGKREGGIIYFANTLIFDLLNKRGRIYSPRRGRFFIPEKISLWVDGKNEVLKFKDANLKLGCLIVKRTKSSELNKGKKDKRKESEITTNNQNQQDKDEVWFSVIMDTRLLDALFTRLFFLKGRGLKYFEPFIMDNRHGIYIYKINWKKGK